LAAGVISETDENATKIMKEKKMIRIAQEYFKRGDQGRPDILDLFHQDVEFYFPKFGFGAGRQSYIEIVKGFEGSLGYIKHDYDSFRFTVSGNYLVVEGSSKGSLSGKSWEGGKTPGGRFCNVFKFRDKLIVSVHVYLDPDYTGEDTARFRWGMDRVW
jgi:ketosteroid isomerase-like protein